MKKIIYVLSVLTLIFTTNSCTKFLDIVPDERPTEEDAFVDEFAAERFLYSCYSYLPAVRVGQTSLDFMTTDEVVTSFEHETFAQFPKGTFTASNPVISYWADLYKGIRQTNLLLANIDKVPGLAKDVKNDYIAQANFLIGYYHFLLARMYGPIIIVEEVEDVNQPAEQYKSRNTYDETVSFIVSKLDLAAEGLPTTRDGNFYGLATKVAAKSIKARMLLYAASPLFNGGGGSQQSFYNDFTDHSGHNLIPTNYNKEKWKIAADAYKEAIELAEAAGAVLYKNSTQPGLPQNQTEKDLRYTFVDKNSKELIWTDTRREGIYDFQNKSTPFFSPGAYNGVSPTLAMVEMFYTENGLPIDKDPTFNYQGRYTVATAPSGGNTLLLNLSREPRFNAWIAYHNSYFEILRPSGVKEVLTQFRRNDDHGIKNRSNNYSPTGYLNKKGVNPQFGLNQNKEAQPTIAESYPWPLIRLAELYLGYAEALLEYDASNITLAKTYIDKVRERAGIPSIDTAWKPIGGATTQATLRSILRQERSIELYLENHRFWDLRRWMTAENALGVQPKGMNISGDTDALFFQVKTVTFPRAFRSPAFYLMPIPTEDINRNENIVQNPGY